MQRALKYKYIGGAENERGGGIGRLLLRSATLTKYARKTLKDSQHWFGNVSWQ